LLHDIFTRRESVTFWWTANLQF